MSEDVYFRAFCDYLNCKECAELAKKVEKGQMSKEEFFEEVLKKHGDQKVEQAHKYAMNVVEASLKKKESEKKEEVESKKEEVEVKPKEEVKQTQTEVKKEEKEGEACPVCTYTEEELKEVEKRKGLKVKSDLKDICLSCVAGMTLSIVKIMEDWYVDDNRKKLDDIRKKIINGEITVEDAIVEVLKLPGAPEAMDRILKDFNSVMERAFEKAANESEEFKKWLEKTQAQSEIA